MSKFNKLFLAWVTDTNRTDQLVKRGILFMIYNTKCNYDQHNRSKCVSWNLMCIKHALVNSLQQQLEKFE